MRFFSFSLDRNTVSFCILLFMAQLNLLFMHYYISKLDCLEWRYMYSIPVCICSTFFDVIALFLFFYILTYKRQKTTLAFTYGVTYLWSFANVIYVRFFNQYLSLSAIGESGRLQDELIIYNIFSEVQLWDIYYLLSFIFFILNIIRLRKIKYTKIFNHLLCIAIFFLLLSQLIYTVYHFSGRSRYNWELYYNRTKEMMGNVVICGTPNLAHFHSGCVRTFIYEVYDELFSRELTDEDRDCISRFYHNDELRSTQHKRSPIIKNVIFVLLESFLSSPIDMVVDGKEITPYLNSIKRDSSVFYRGRMISDIAGGESADGQFIYMTGLLPMQHKVTVSLAKNRDLPALPKILSEEMNIKHTEIYVPTLPNMWQQEDMNKAYGINKMYSQRDIMLNSDSSVTDKDVFEFASKKICSAKEPFFSMILSLSTHAPYNTYVGENYLKDDVSFSAEYRNYLNTCHYTDKHLGFFINKLKEKGLYDRSLIIICADHHAHVDRMGVAGMIETYIPLFIINGCIESNAAWKGDYHQLDVYTTILDVLGLDYRDWKGLGYTILSPRYRNSVNKTTKDISAMIVEGDFFADKTVGN